MKSTISLFICLLLSCSLFAQVKPAKVQSAQSGLSLEEKTLQKKRSIKDGLNGKPITLPGNIQGTVSRAEDSEWEKYKKAFIETLWEQNPGWASWEGYHKYDHILTIPDEATRTKKESIYKKLLENLDQQDQSSFMAQDIVDYSLIKNFLESSIWYERDFRSYEWNPSDYNVGGAFDLIVNYDKKSAEDRLDDILVKIKKVIRFYKVAQDNLKDATIEHTELAISQVRGSTYVFEESIPKLMAESVWPENKKEALNNELKSAIKAIESYASWLEDTYLPKLKDEDSARSFRLSEDLYAKKFKYNLGTDLSPKELYNKAQEDKKDTHKKMYKLTQELWSKYMKEDMPSDKIKATKMLIGKISEEHTERDKFIETIRGQIPELESFVREKDLMYMDPSKPLVVRETPAYMAGVAGASISSPGPYDKDGETYYNVTPLTNYSDEEAESYLREYNDYMLQILNIHEAIPGHYVQLVYSNESPSLIKSILGNGAMIEGWACYTERMMLEEGYGDDSPELWLMYYKWFLRIACNTILDYSIHNLNMSEEEAMDLLMNEAFQEDIEASKKWKRARLTQVQLCSYYNGFREIYDFREEYMKSNPEIGLKEFHEKFLSYGSAPVSQIRKMMYEDVKK